MLIKLPLLKIKDWRKEIRNRKGKIKWKKKVYKLLIYENAL